MIKFTKECVWSFKLRRQPKRIADFPEGTIADDISAKSEAEIVDAGYAVYCNADGSRAKGAQTVEVGTKDIQTKPVRKAVKVTNDNQSD